MVYASCFFLKDREMILVRRSGQFHNSIENRKFEFIREIMVLRSQLEKADVTRRRISHQTVVPQIVESVFIRDLQLLGTRKLSRGHQISFHQLDYF
ncbi:hypothetical protein PMAYCL1PPCAC_25559, partial [Pristionchus mayeri]